MNLTQKILKAHLVEGRLEPGRDLAIRIDQTLLQDATGTMALLEFEALGVGEARAGLSVQYVDHNILQADYRNADDHRFLQTACQKFGISYSRPGNGVSHQVHFERFGAPGRTLLGADSHTPGAAGASMLAMGAGGLDVALAMAGIPYHLPCPRVLGVRLTGLLPPWVSAKDVILEMLRRFDVKGCLGKAVEYYGPGVAALGAPDRMVIGNMGAELGATTTVFPSDEKTRSFLEAQGRGNDWTALEADPGADYDERAEIDLGALEPLIALPSSPGRVVPVREAAGTRVQQVLIGSSANSGFRDFMVAAKMLQGRTIHPDVSLHINPGSRRILENLIHFGGAELLLQAGARINEAGCLGCIGMGQAPGTGQISLRTFPRNFPGRSGTLDDRVYLCSPETAAASALTGVITDPRTLGRIMDYPRVEEPSRYLVEEQSIPPLLDREARSAVEIIRGPNIKPLPVFPPLEENLEAEVVIRVGDNLSTDSILPAGSRILPLRSNIEAISQFVFSPIDADFPAKCKGKNGLVTAGENYGQGSSREHAALAPRYLGVRVKIAKSFARIHKANLANFGILPLTFADPADFERLAEGTRVVLAGIRGRIAAGETEIPVSAGGREILTRLDVSPRQRAYLLAGGALNYFKGELAASR